MVSSIRTRSLHRIFIVGLFIATFSVFGNLLTQYSEKYVPKREQEIGLMEAGVFFRQQNLNTEALGKVLRLNPQVKLIEELPKNPQVSDSFNKPSAVRNESHEQQQQHHVSTKINFTQGFNNSLNKLLEPLGSLNVNCEKLFEGDKNETLKAEKLIKSQPYKDIPLKHFEEATRNCRVFRLTRGYESYISDEERDFPLAFSILVHKSLDQFERLLRAIYRPNNYYCIHVDKKVKPEFMAAILGIVNCFKNVFIASKLEVVVYAGFTRLKADINCMEELYQNFSDWKYVLNMAGSEMALKSNIEMVKTLKLYNGSNLVGKNMKSLNPWRWVNHYETVVKGLTGTVERKADKNGPAPFNLTMSKGSAYVVLSRAMVAYVLNDPIPKQFLEYCKRTYSPDEQYWATLNNLADNPHLKTPGGSGCRRVHHMQRGVLWYSGNCHGRNIRSVCTFGAGDLPWIKQLPQLILNKFDFNIDYVSYYCLEEKLKTQKKVTELWDKQTHLEYLETHLSKNCSKKST